MTVTVRYRTSADSDPDFDPDLEVDPVPNLSVAVREMLPHRPNRWAFALFDNRDGSCVERTFPFDSCDEAAANGHARLDDLKRRASEATKRLVIVSDDDAQLLENLKRLVAGNQRLHIVVDRRRPLASMERKVPDRRTVAVSAEAPARGWWIVPGDTVPSA